MRETTLRQAEQEAKRFLEKVRLLRIRVNIEGMKDAYELGCKESAAVKRASLDLTRALADLRWR